MDEKTYIFEGKTTNEEIEKGLKELKTTKYKVDIKVLENEEKKTFFSILAPKVVKVEMKFKEGIQPREEKEPIDASQVIKELESFMKNFIANVPTKDLAFEIKQDRDLIKIDIKDEKAAYLIGYRGETLNSLQNILSNIASNDKQEKVRILLNISNYREKREKDLTTLAGKIAESVARSKKSITLEPMSAYDRKIVHSALQEHDKVKTYSIGKEPYRKVVVSLK